MCRDKILIIISMLLSVNIQAATVQNGTTVNTGNGKTISKFGNNMLVGSDGTRYQRFGNALKDSNGYTWSIFGNKIKRSDGKTCSFFGNSIKCSPPIVTPEN